MDIKTQAFKDEFNAVDDWDQRKSTGQFRGAEEGLNVKTLFEFRADDELSDILTNPARVDEFVKPGDNALQVLNRIQAKIKLAGSIAGPLGAALPWNQIGTFAYDND